jgi:hypothetical protein
MAGLQVTAAAAPSGLLSRATATPGRFFERRRAKIIKGSTVNPGMSLFGVIASAAFKLLQEENHSCPTELFPEGF